MANKRLIVCPGIVLFLCFVTLRGSSTPVSVPLGSVSDLLIQSALDSLNENSPTHHTYKSGNLISAQKLLESPYVIYRLTLNLEPNCSPNEATTCSREACAIDLRQHEGGVIDVQKNSIQCMYLHPQTPQDDVQQRGQEVSVQEVSAQEPGELVESVDKLVVNETVRLNHEVQTVTDDIERPFIAVRATDRNYCAGCPYELNPTLAGLAAFGEQVVQSMDDSGRSDFKHKVVSIVRVTRAVPPGSNVVQYELLLEIGESNCLRTGLSRRAECSLLTNVPIKLCLVAFEERPWQLNSRKITRNNCTDVPSTENELDGSTEPRAVSEAPATSQSRGELSTPLGAEASSRPEICDQVAEEGTIGCLGSSIDEYLEVAEPTATTGSRDEEARIPVSEEPNTKIVLGTDDVEQKNVGFTDKIKEFDAFLEDFDLQIKPRDPPSVDRSHGRDPVTEEIIRPEVVVRPSARRSSVDRRDEQSTRSKRSLVDTPMSDARLVMKLARKALRTLDDIDTDNKKRMILRLIDSKKEETVDGAIYHLTMMVVPTECDEKNQNREDCDPRGPAKVCKVQIHTDDERPVQSAKVVQSQCFPERSRIRETRVKRSQRVIMGRVHKTTDNPDVISYAKKAVEKFSNSSESLYEPFLIEISEVEVQLISGMRYKIKVKLGESTCLKGVKENCQLKTDSQPRDYLISFWSQPWIDHGSPEMKIEPVVENDLSRARRSAQIVGGPTQKSTDDEEIRTYAKMGVDKFSKFSESSNEPFLIEIVEASAQVVSGMLYKIKVRLGESTCPKGTKENCQLKSDGRADDYLITVWSQPWIDHGSPDVKIEPVAENDLSRARRSAQIVGGPTQKSTDDEEIRTYAKMGVDKFSKFSESSNEPFLIEIVEASAQLVSGMLYKIKVRLGESTCPKGTKENCQLKSDGRADDYLITVWSQPWIDHGSPDVKIEPVAENDLSRARRSAQIVGGPTQKSTDDEEIRTYAKMGVDKFSKFSESSNEPFLIEIVEASAQVVSGMLYKIKVRLGESTCPKGTKENCQLKSDGRADDYLITVWSQPWIDNGSPDVKIEPVAENDLSRARRSAQIVGGPTQKSTDDEEIRTYAKMGVDKFSKFSESSNEPFLIEIVEASAQVVSGMLYKIKVRLGESTCPKGTKENCQLKSDGRADDYLITVWSQPWIDHGSPDVKIEPVAENDLSRARRSPQIPGGEMQKSTDDPEIRAYAEKGIRKYSETSGLTSEPILLKIIEATAQVVSGMLYKIRVRLGESTCPKGSRDECQLRSGSPIRDFLITVWSQPWIDHGNPDIKVEEETSRSERSRREALLLGSKRLSTDDEDIKNYARRALERYSDSSELRYEPILAEIKEAVVQTVSGKLYKINVVMAESDCPRGTRENCRAVESGETNECLVTVWSQPWRDRGEPEIKIKCDDGEKNRERRSLRGANYSAKMLKLRRNIELEKRFDEFMEKFDINYPTEEEKTARFRVFKDNMKVIDELRNGEQGTAEYGVTMFADLTPEEFRARYTGLKPEMRQENDLPLPVAEIPDIELPEEFDWRHRNIVTEVKNQGSCGSCWAFAVTGNVEGLYALKHGKLLSLSEQELVDCDTFDSGCNGGLPDNAYRAIETLGGLETETDYPYEGENEKCHFDKGKARVAITSGLNITSNETGMAQWLVKNGPISIGINANAMQFYMGGVSHPFKFLCNKDNLDHGVLIVGYGIHKYPIFKKSMPYWIIKNSWGPRWGEQGYYRVYRGDGTCGLNTMATSAVVV